MSHTEPTSAEATHPSGSVSRRKFLAAGGMGVVGMSLPDRGLAKGKSSPTSVIQIIPTGGMSQLDTFDPKPLAPRDIRGPQRAIGTALPGIYLAESLPLLAQRVDMLTVIRSLHHSAAPLHETGLQLLQAGQLVSPKEGSAGSPSVAMEFCTLHPDADFSCIELGGPLQDTGTRMYRAEAAQTPPGMISPQRLFAWEEVTGNVLQFQNQPADVQARYGKSRFGELLWQAMRLVECGTRLVTVYLFDTLRGLPTWDAHGSSPHAPATVFTYRDELGPRFDRACTALLDDLAASGLLQHTLVLCAGEMGRTPRINEQNGRDHWTSAWSGFLAGAGVTPGQVIGATDAHGGEITDAPIPLESLPSLVREALGISPPLAHSEQGMPLSAQTFIAPV